MADSDELGSGYIERRPNTNLIHFGSPVGSQYTRPQSPLIITSQMPEDNDTDSPAFNLGVRILDRLDRLGPDTHAELMARIDNGNS
jgi:hypothetical protein